MRTKRQPAGTALSAFRRVPVAAAVAIALSQGAMAATYTVSSPAAFGPGTLADAINTANSNCGTDSSPVIKFGGPFAISQSSPLPAFQCFSSANPYTPTIDGATSGSVANSDSTGWNATVAVAVDGTSNFAMYGCAIEHVDFGGYGGYLTVKDLEVRNFSYGNITAGLCGRVKVSGSVIRDNYIGVKALGGSVVGGGTPQQRNLIPGNQDTGIEFDGATTITNNVIGVTFDGALPFPSPSNYGIRWCGCNTPSGTISDNTVVAAQIGVHYWSDNKITFSGNRVGMNPSASAAMSIAPPPFSESTPAALYIFSSQSTISGNVFGGFATAIEVGSGSTVTISGNKIGTTGDGSASTASVTDGIYMYSNYGSRIDGANVISGMSGTGIYLQDSSNTVVYGNLIGTDASGNSAIGNDQGLYIGFVSGNNTIEANVISGNFFGVYSSDASFTTFKKNNVGVGTNGSSVPNKFGFAAECGTNLSFIENIISANSYGGLELRAIQLSTLDRNTISGNGAATGEPGLVMSYTNCGSTPKRLEAARAKSIAFDGSENESSDNTLTLNTITSNAGGGILIQGGSNNEMSQNTIASNGGDGVGMFTRSTFDSSGAPITIVPVGNSMLGNAIYDNAAKNINLGYPGGYLPNDMGDVDSGLPNNGQNFPDLTGAVFDPVTGNTTVTFLVDTFAPGNYLIEFFANSIPGAPAGQTYVDSTTMAAPVAGPQSYVLSGQRTNLSATATRLFPLDTFPPAYAPTDTSELSPQVPGSTLPVPGVSVQPASVNFGDVVVGRSSGTSTVTVQSTGTADYVINALREDTCTGPAICTSGAFSCSTTCSDGSTWAPKTACTITASFTPSALGTQTKTLALCDNVAGSPRTITFTGNGVPTPAVDIYYTPASWSFGEVLVGLQSASRSFTLTNAGGNVVYLGAASTTNPDFVITGGTCGATLAAGATCATDVAFAPSARGGVNAALQIVGSNVAPASAAALRSKATTATTNTASALLLASGAQFGELRLPESMTFGTLVLHADSRLQILELRNTGNGPIAISNITVSGPFTMTNDCGATLAVGASCTIAVTFNPVSLGTANGTLNVVTDAVGGARAIALGATVIADARPVVRITPTVLGFGNHQIGTQSNAQRITITNEGAQVANLLPIAIVQPESVGTGEAKAEFTATSTCGATLAPQATCFADIVFRALGFGERKGELQVLSNSPDSPQKASLAGTGCRPYDAGVNRSGRDPCK